MIVTLNALVKLVWQRGLWPQPNRVPSCHQYNPGEDAIHLGLFGVRQLAAAFDSASELAHSRGRSQIYERAAQGILMNLLSKLLIAFLAAALAAAAFGQSPQSPPRRTAISGIVQDSNGDSIPGVQVTLRSGAKLVRSTATDVQGRFKFPSVAPGSYTISAESTGFNPYSSVFTAGLTPAAPLRIVLSLASMKQTVTVSAGANHVTPDTSNNLNGISENAQQLKNLPVFDEDIIGTLSRFLDSDSEGTGGAAMVVNGVPVENVAVTPSAIKSIKIDNDPFDAEYSRPGWGRMEITTKAGTQQYHGEVNFIFRDAVFNARNAFSATRPPEQRRKFE
ncbi:MAG: carboxypeptidase-like regulatory domain-containing protein [Terriglobia bacterium]